MIRHFKREFIMAIVGFIILALSSLVLGRDIDTEEPIVDTNVGTIRGVMEDGHYKFLGIPYAKVNESNPFGAPLQYPNFNTIYEASSDANVCPQQSATIQTLDCLRLNVFVPVTHSSDPLPVLVWIHGGAFIAGSGTNLRAKNFIQHNIILVTINYRLGPYGFMCLDTPEVPGNAGLKDQYAAVEWVRNNIAAFGGNANKITVFGQSAGGMSIDMHLLSHRPKVFDQAIMQSGNSLCPEELIPSDRTIPIQLATYLGYDTDDTKDALQFLIDSDIASVITAFQDLSIYIRPCVEKEFDGVDSFLTVHPELANPNITGIPIIAGFNSHDELLLVGTFQEYYDGVDPFKTKLEVLYDLGEDEDRMVNLVHRFYIGDNEVSEHFVLDLVAFFGDIKQAHTVSRSIRRYLNNGAQDIYHYVFQYVGERTAYNVPSFNGTKPGAVHMDELQYLFDGDADVETTTEDQLLIDRLTTMWTNFVKYGEPTPEITELLPVKWDRVTKEVFNYLHINLDPYASNRPYHNRMAFWDLFYKMNKDKFIIKY